MVSMKVTRNEEENIAYSWRRASFKDRVGCPTSLYTLEIIPSWSATHTEGAYLCDNGRFHPNTKLY
jgi:hypothetical protein